MMSITADNFSNLAKIDWDFFKVKTNHLTHSMHPYPAKFIPQIPHGLITELSREGDTVGDIFCGSGTTLVEALLLKRNAVGVDANPLACLMSKTKTSRITNEEVALLLEVSLLARKKGELIGNNAVPYVSSAWRPDFPKLNFWFNSFVIEELAEIKKWCSELNTDLTLPLFNGVHSMGNYADFLRCSASRRCSNCIGLM